MSFDKIEVRVFSGPDQVQVGSNTEPDLIVMNIGPKGDTGATGNTGPAGPNSVTSATTSDGTGQIMLDTLAVGTCNILDEVVFDTLTYTFAEGSAQALKDALSISFADVSDAETGTATLTLANAVLGNALIVGNGDTAKGRYDLFGNTSHLQWYSDSALYGERSFTITTENLTSSGEYVYKYPVGNGTLTLTGNTNGEPDKLTAGTISGATTFNATSYTYGTGAAAAHRTALGLTTLATTTPGTNVANFLEFPTSANLASALTDENGTGGGFVRAEGATLTSPALVGPVNLTSQDASTADRVMTRSLADTRYGQSLASYLSADGPTVNNSTTLTNTGLELSLTVGLWYVDATLFFRNTTNAAGGKAKVVVASGSATNARGTAAIGNQVVNRIASISYLLTERSTTNPIATDGIFWATGILNVTADCVIRVQYAQGAAQATDSNSLAGSYLIAQKIN